MANEFEALHSNFREEVAEPTYSDELAQLLGTYVSGIAHLTVAALKLLV